MRVATVDLGTNSTRLLVADVEDGAVREVDRRLVITRLGEGVDARRKLLPTAVARVRNVLVDYRRAAEALGAKRTLTLATSAVRDAENGEAFLGEIEWSYGFVTRLLSGDDEAALTFRGVAAGRPVHDGTLVLDVGGGSTELILGGPNGVAFHESFDLGCVRLTERFLGDEAPARRNVESCREAVRSLLEERVPEDVRPTSAIGVAGTVTTLATLHLGLREEDPDRIHGHRIPVGWIERELPRLAAATVAELRLRPGIHPDRAPVLVAGVAVVAEVLAYFRLPKLEVSEQDLLHGGALAAAELPEPQEGAAPPGAFTCC
ncbi:MAG: Ppx/GppA family phosphatase [Thermoleophilia bacterium]|nr:Ppx/GppA family phosphatase [Thermoleophilia bacterium]